MAEPRLIDAGPLAAGAGAPGGDKYGSFVCGVFMLNMVLGTGPMSLPFAFNAAGFLLSCGFLALMMSFSYVSVTYIIEGLGTADRLRRPAKRDAEASPVLGQGEVPEITERIEIGALGEQFLPAPFGKLAYFILIVYAYGVLTVYVIAGCASLSQEVTTVFGIDSYRPIVGMFVVLVTPICLLDFQKTRPLQLCVGLLRLFAVLAMMLVMVRYLIDVPNFSGRMLNEIPLFNLEGLPAIFGNTAFTFMIHHSVPGLIFPLYRHADAAKIVGGVYLVSYVIYALQGFLALWSFSDATYTTCGNTPGRPCTIQALFNLNFSSADYPWAAKFIVLYPLLVISVFPLVGITLRNNLKAACGAANTVGFDPKNLAFTALAVGPPYVVAFFTKDVQMVLKYVGCYFGLSLMFCIPCLIVWQARRSANAASLGQLALQSRFASRTGIASVLILFVGTVTFSTVSFAMGN